MSERALRTWLKTYEEEGVLKASERGRHSKTISPIVDPEFRDKFCFHVKSNSRNNGDIFCIFCTEVSECAFTYKFSILGEPVLTTTTLAKWVNSELNLREEDGYSAACMKTWLHRCGFKVSKYRYTSNNWM